jgi:hypothetical protein
MCIGGRVLLLLQHSLKFSSQVFFAKMPPYIWRSSKTPPNPPSSQAFYENTTTYEQWRHLSITPTAKRLVGQVVM